MAMSTYAQGELDSLQTNELDSVSMDKLSLLSAKMEVDTLVGSDSLFVNVDKAKSKVDGLVGMTNEVLNQPEKKAQEVEGKVNSGITNRANKLKTTVESKLSKKLPSSKSKELNDLASPPATDLPELRLDQDIKAPALAQEPIPEDALQKTKESGKITEQLDGVKDVPLEQVDKLKSIEEVKEVTEQASELKEANETIKSHNEELKSIKEGDIKIEEGIEQEAEKQIANLDGVSDLQEQTTELDKIKLEQEAYKKQLEEYKSQKVIKDQLKQRATERGVEFFAKHQEKLKSMQGNYGSYKKKFLKVKGESRWQKLKSNAMKGKSLRERLVLGGYTQVIKLRTNAVDLSPILGYKLSGFFVVGVGGTYRLHLGQDGLSPNTDQRVYGYRGYLEAKVYKGFYLHGEYESMRTDVPTQLPAVDVSSRQWVEGLNFGVGKSYKIHKKINGYIQLLYNAAFEFNESPYSKKLMFRIGLEGALGKEKRSSKTTD